MKIKRSIRSKFIILLSAISVVLIFILSLIAIISIQSLGKRQIESYKTTAMEDAKLRLKNYTDIAFATAESIYNKYNDRSWLEEKYGKRLKNIIDTANSIIQALIARVKRGELSTYAAQQEAARLIRSIRYDDGTGYIWINDTRRPYPRMVMHPTVPALDGKILDDKKYNVADGGKNLFVAFLDVTEKGKEGFVQYLWPKPTKDGLTEDQPKLSYVIRIPEWNWIIGTGVYIDDTKTDMQNEIKSALKRMRYDNGVGYFWINDTGRPYPRMVMHPTVPELDGKILDDKKYNVAEGGKNLFVAFVDITDKEGEGYVRYLWPKPTKDGLTEDQPKLSFVRLFKPLNWIIGTGFYIDDIDANVLAKQEEINKTINSLILTVLVASFVLIIAGISISMFFIMRLTGPLRLVISKLKELSSGTGDLRLRLPELTKDEVGVLSGEFNRFVEQLATIIIEIRNNIKGTTELGEHLAESTKELTEKVELLAKNASETLTENDNLAKEIETTNKAVNGILDFLQELSEKIESQSSAVTQSSASIQQITASIGNISRVADERKEKTQEIYSLIENTGQNMDKTVNSIEDISRSADDIKALVSVIREIAEHTNLLSINASIEAAHAGDAGAGFSVVADEINRLATSAASHASRISGEIEAILNKITDSSKFSKETSETLKKLMDYVRIVTDGIEEIQLGLSELSVASREIHESTNSLMEISHDIMSASSGTKDKADYIRNTLSRVTGIAENTRNKMHVLGSMLKDMESSFENMREVGNRTVEASNNLENLIMHFSL